MFIDTKEIIFRGFSNNHIIKKKKNWRKFALYFIPQDSKLHTNQNCHPLTLPEALIQLKYSLMWHIDISHLEEKKQWSI